METTPDADLADRLAVLGQAELDEINTFLDSVSGFECGALLVEACRCLDHAHVIQLMSAHEHAMLPPHDFDLIVRGWNVLLSLLLSRIGGFSGVPMLESTPGTRQVAMSLMHAAGRHVLFRRTADMVRHGMVSGVATDTDIEVWISDRTLSDHFHDQIDRSRLTELNAQFARGQRPDPRGPQGRQIREEMAALTFPWKTPKGVMVGYTTTPEIDDFFLHSVIDSTIQWRDEAGIHQDAELGACTGADLTAVVNVLLSFYLKHIMFVEEAILRPLGVNQHMSLTIWKKRDELLGSLIAAGASSAVAEAALDLITVRPADAAFFLDEHTPGIPLVIEISEGYLLTPVSGIFRNPFHHIRMLRESASSKLQNAFREHREGWMADDLYRLFQGNRFQRVAGQTRLRRNGKTVTDIDAAIFDNVTEELVLFQLKWQDFSTSSVRVQRSKAKNFVNQVGAWGEKVTSWLDEFGVAALCKSLKLRLPSGELPTLVRLWAIGRSNARFQSYGYDTSSQVLVLAWPQFVRLRFEIGLGEDVFVQITDRAVEEIATVAKRTPLPFVIDNRGVRTVFKDIWSSLDEN
ncbi:hypothetical protein ABE444_07695 [Brevundimonas pondensis]|uniref:hypothetical protein n=1 Tax=Brevundimonas pondensis TaxID=2774189 RepID=UPI003207EE07